MTISKGYRLISIIILSYCPAEGSRLDNLHDGDQLNWCSQEDLVGRQVRMAANMLDLNPDGRFNKCDLNIV